MKKIYTVLAFLCGTVPAFSQNPGLVISEVLANPNGTDNSFEWVELVATQNINFASTPYSVVVSNNGTATANGWVQGGNITYGFNITTGSVTAGDVVYVGGSTMLPTGTKIRVIDVVTTPGDGFGSAAAGVIGNGGSNADGVAVFNVPVTSLTSATVPVDAILFGTGIGSALVSGGTAGYQLPVNDMYAGGKLQSTSFFAGDPGSDISIRATGSYNTTTNAWVGQRSWSTQTAVNDNATAIALVTATPPGQVAISGVTQTVSETAGTVNVNVTLANPNASVAKVAFGLSSYTNATLGSDFSWASDTLTIPANTAGTFPFTINLNNDLLAERTERIIVKLTGTVNATITGNSFQIIYLTDDDYVAPVSSNELQLNLLSSFSNGAEGTNSAEIVAYDSTNFRLYIANSVGAKLDIVNFSNPAAPTLISSVSVTPYGNINSLTVYNGIVACAIENTDPQANGSVVFFDADGTFINQVTVGAMPDMITFNNDHTKIVVACEGEPKTDYSIDPEGSIAIVDLTPGIASLTNANVAIANFNAWNGQEATLRAQGIRIFGPGSNTSQDLEPEYITLGDDNQTAYVSLQENNAMAVVNLNTATVTELRPLGYMDYSSGNGMDASDQTAGIYITSVPVKGAFMPDALAHATIGGTEYIFSANEGDAREFAAITDVARISATSLDPTAFPDQNILKHNQFLGRLNALQATGDTDGDGDKDEIHVLGTRSFSIWNAATGALVFDSKDLLEQITSTHPTLNGLFNASNTSGAVQMKNRSDDKGPEVEGITTAFINGNHYLFVSMERIGGVMLFNIDNPAAPVYSGYYNNRSVATNGPDRGAEGIIYIRKEASPNNHDIVILANEISSTLSVYQINSCVELAGATISATDLEFCAGQTAQLSIPGDAQSSVQWYKDNAILTGQTGNTLTVSTSGDYRVYVSNTALACADTTVATTITVHSLPTVAAGIDQTVCMGTSVTLSGSGAQSYMWSNSVNNGVAFTPYTTTNYTVTGTDANGCQNTDQVLVTVNSLPNVYAGVDQAVCEGASVTLTASGAPTLNWNNGVSNNVSFTPGATTTYTVTGISAAGCQNTDQVLVTVNPLPSVDAGADQTVCENDMVTLSGSGANTYNWDNGVTDNSPFAATTTTTYTVTGISAEGCQNTDAVMVTVNALPSVSAGADQTICEGTAVTLSGSGSAGLTYDWNNGVTDNTAFTPASTATYTLTGTDANGCSQNDLVLVTVNSQPTVIAGSDLTICAGQAITLIGSGAAGLTYSWNNGVTNGVSFTPAASATYTLTGTDANGCQGTDEMSLTVNNGPAIDLGNDTTTCTYYGPVTLDAGSGFTAYDWNTGATTATITVSASGTYTATVTGSNGCETTDAIMVTFDPCLGLDENAIAIALYPNPTNGIVNIQSSDAGPLTATVMSISGGKLFTTNETAVDLSELASGTYLVLIEQGAFRQVFRVEKN